MKILESGTAITRLLSGLAVACGMAVTAMSPAIAHADPLPTLVANIARDDLLVQTFQNGDAWKNARSRIGRLLYADHKLAGHNDQDLSYVFGRMKSWNLDLELETGAIKPWAHTGDQAFAAEKPEWDRLSSLGGQIASFAMDEPLNAAQTVLAGEPASYAVAQVARFIADVRQAYPDAKIGDIEPYPALNLATHESWIIALQQQLLNMGVRGLDFYRLDVDWISFTAAQRGSWADVKTLEEFCHSNGLPFSLIYWASNYPSLAKNLKTTKATWNNALISEGKAYQAMGAAPDQYVIETWVGAPSIDFPDTSGTTFMGSVLNFSLHFLIDLANN